MSYQVIKYFKGEVAKNNVPLQIDVFGVTSFGEEQHIGQNIKLFANSVDAVCPMVYPSHYEPYKIHSQQPYQTISKSLIALRTQFDNKVPFKLYPYIELYNYRYPMSKQQRYDYIYAQLKAVQDNHANGWYAWSANNYYDSLFYVLKNYKGLRTTVSS